MANTKKTKNKPKTKVSHKQAKAAHMAKKAEFESLFKSPAKIAGDEKSLEAASETTPRRKYRRFKTSAQATEEEAMKRLSHKALLKAEKVLESINVSEMPHSVKASAFDLLIKNARLLMGLSTQNVAKADLRLVALKMLDTAQKSKNRPKNDEAAKTPLIKEYQEVVILEALENIH